MDMPADSPNRDMFLCQNFKYSPDGRYLSFTYMENFCSRMLLILDTNSMQVVYSKSVNSLYPEFINNGKMFTTTGHCEGGATIMVDLKTGMEQDAGDYAWEYDWNQAHTAFMVPVTPYQGFISSSFWAYQAQADQLINPPKVNYGVQSPSTWVPAGTHILYEQREFTVDNTLNPLPKGNSQILRLDMATGKTQEILSDPGYDYWLCGNPFQTCTFRHPDWVLVARSPVPTDPDKLETYKDAVVACLDIRQCFKDMDLFALNWRTGELLPWDKAPAAAPSPTPTVQFKPRINDGAPLPPVGNSRRVFVDPSGAFALYVGADGSSLWRVTKDGQPIVWVENGENFIYLP